MSSANRTVDRLRPFTTTIFAEMSALAVEHDAVNLGQGFPDTDGPASMLDAAREAISDGRNQYPPGIGVPELRHAVARQQRDRYGLDYDPDREVLITVGATEAIAGAVVGLVEPGDEVIMIEPYYDAYAAAVAMAGGVRRVVPLVPDGDGFRLDRDRLATAFGPKTSMVLVNSPHNPTGTVLSTDDLAEIARLCVAHDVIAVTDEVYEYLVFDGRTHTPLAALPGMRARTLRISSSGKTFNCTGWKVGWVSGPPELVAAARTAKQYMSYVGSGPFQPAVAHALEHELEWVRESARGLQAKRDLISTALSDAGFAVHRSEATYFVCADPRPLGVDDGIEFCRSLPERIGVAAVPVSVFTDDREPWHHMLRFAFAKRDEVIAEAAERLRRL
ncbi:MULTISPECIES: pyridoxal phosphate-dependent aminotransferase [unclassified Gordonia (in: high G+C Gram-positive bacteria)]|uniref:pyridoxal phosphate-dependent aminotransferase n=1 Tax=unclassified Gordonia (in: high G+C Gram-positive bacteria) TaxID=2657482 RepID=UPI000990A0EA|nr:MULTISPECIES: pyridoxal phosphate-dependent aminotransferase [unclassified Gordonia (in: high G+C Gram-positive bacteria)]MBR7191582.1 pyridoxal phosphate-dependent aminotransferase [Gordonia sp. SCSIO 19800]